MKPSTNLKVKEISAQNVMSILFLSYLMIPRSYSFQRIDVKVGNPNLVFVFKMNRSTQVRIYRDQLVLVNQREKMFYNFSSFTRN